MTAALLEFPDRNLADIPARLRTIAAQIEAGEYGDAHTLVWVIDEGDGVLSVGLVGEAAEAGATANFMLSLAQHKLLSGCLAVGQ